MKIREFLKNNIFITIFIIIMIPITILIVAGYTFSADLSSNPEKLNVNEEYIYHIDVSFSSLNYDHYDNSIIQVEDKLPNDLEFVEFVQKQDEELVALPETDNYGCNGRVLNGVDGLKYDESTRIVSFSIIDLSNSCSISVGIKVRTPNVTERRDFYNTAAVKYNGNVINSNVVHSFIGEDNVERHNVKYTINGLTQEERAALTPVTKKYSAGQEVAVEINPTAYGYDFSGWTSSDVTISNGKFTMPNTNVELVGTFTETTAKKYKLKFTVNDDKIAKNITMPKDREYYEGEIIDFLSLLPYSAYDNDEIYIDNEAFMPTGYMISDDISLSENGLLTMPAKDVTVTFLFEKIPVAVLYSFYGNIIPLNAQLPSSTANPSRQILSMFERMLSYTSPDEVYGYSLHYVGDKVTLPQYKSTNCQDLEHNKVVKCRFIGWLYNDEVIVSGIKNNNNNNYYYGFPPYYDDYGIPIRGSWMKINGTFTPEINMEIIDEKDTYEKGDKVRFKTTITNNSSVDIKNLLVSNNLDGQVINTSPDYNVDNDYIKISELKANESVVIYSTYTVNENKTNTIINEIQLLSAEADNEYYLENEEYKATAAFNTKKVGATETNETVVPNNPPVNETNQTEEKNETPSIIDILVPKTLDNAYIYMILAAISLVVIGAIVFVLIKNNKNSK